MKFRILFGFFFLFLPAAQAQVLRDINYNYHYDPTGLFSLSWKVVKTDNTYKVFYEILRSDTTQEFKGLNIQLETRESLGEKSGNIISTDPALKQAGLTGSTHFPAEHGQNIIVAKITVSDQGKQKVFTYYKQLPKNKSLNLSSGNRVVTNSFIAKNQSVTLDGLESDKPIQISYYSTPFPAGAPAFSIAQAKVAKAIKPDSAFTVNSTTPVAFTKKGLYLAQHDTSSTDGVAFRVEEDYPKLGKLESLAGPLLYICTKQETEKLRQAGNDKKKFDQVILTITGNSERARTFMRGYFKRVEWANLYFSSYKEGWKTDRGMIYIIFGLPEEVYLFDDREIWEYKNDNVKIRFQFVKSPSLFDPDNYVLIRDKKYTNTWYEMVDLWRKARF